MAGKLSSLAESLSQSVVIPDLREGQLTGLWAHDYTGLDLVQAKLKEIDQSMIKEGLLAPRIPFYLWDPSGPLDLKRIADDRFTQGIRSDANDFWRHQSTIDAVQKDLTDWPFMASGRASDAQPSARAFSHSMMVLNTIVSPWTGSSVRGFLAASQQYSPYNEKIEELGKIVRGLDTDHFYLSQNRFRESIKQLRLRQLGLHAFSNFGIFRTSAKVIAIPLLLNLDAEIMMSWSDHLEMSLDGSVPGLYRSRMADFLTALRDGTDINKVTSRGAMGQQVETSFELPSFPLDTEVYAPWQNELNRIKSDRSFSWDRDLRKQGQALLETSRRNLTMGPRLLVFGAGNGGRSFRDHSLVSQLRPYWQMAKRVTDAHLGGDGPRSNEHLRPWGFVVGSLNPEGAPSDFNPPLDGIDVFVPMENNYTSLYVDDPRRVTEFSHLTSGAAGYLAGVLSDLVSVTGPLRLEEAKAMVRKSSLKLKTIEGPVIHVLNAWKLFKVAEILASRGIREASPQQRREWIADDHLYDFSQEAEALWSSVASSVEKSSARVCDDEKWQAAREAFFLDPQGRRVAIIENCYARRGYSVNAHYLKTLALHLVHS